jgi:hypothetical protein
LTVETEIGIPFRLPGTDPSLDVSWSPRDVAGRVDAGGMRVRAFSSDVCGRTMLCEGCLTAEPTLAENELLDVFLDDSEGVREDTEDE